jgi:hypothetical protein
VRALLDIQEQFLMSQKDAVVDTGRIVKASGGQSARYKPRKVAVVNG